jgi:hypothetical protein
MMSDEVSISNHLSTEDPRITQLFSTQAPISQEMIHQYSSKHNGLHQLSKSVISGVQGKLHPSDTPNGLLMGNQYHT